MKRIIPLFTALALSTVASGQTPVQREICRVFASVQRSYAELRDQGVSLEKAQQFQQEIAAKLKLEPKLAKELLGAVKRTYTLNWSPDVTEISAYAACLDGFRQP